MFTPRAHQSKFADMFGTKKRVLNFDGCGTGKTLSCVLAVQRHFPGKRVLVFAPLTILEPAWGKDLAFGWPQTTVAIASGSMSKKLKAFNSKAQWVITNHDSVKMVVENELYKDFDVVIIDEGDAFRNRTSKRSKAMVTVAKHVEMFCLMTGTPTPKSVTDIWHLAFLVDAGERLGQNFFGFRQQVCDARPVPGAPPGAMDFTDKEGANDHVSLQLSDITTRVTLNDVAELPDTTYRTVLVDLPSKLRAQYEFLKKQSIMALDSGEVVTAIHAGSRMQKLLQVLSGALYDEYGEARNVHVDRYALVMDLAEEADHSLVAFNWTHQREGLVAEAKKRKITYEIIDGSVPASRRSGIVERFQAGLIQTLFVHPQSAGHGLTLTRANRIIWASPNYRADLYEQLNHRIIRTGQVRKTEIIHIAAANSVEETVYEKLMGKQVRMLDLLNTLKELAQAA